MSSGFSFARGNLAKVAGIPLYALGELATRLVPRSPSRWVLGSAFGFADGPVALVAAARDDGSDRQLVWLYGDPREAAAAAAHGLRTVRRGSLAGWWQTLRASVVVVTHGAGDVNRYAVRGAYLVQLWHGSPLKRLHLDSPRALEVPVLGRWRPAQRAMAAMYRRGLSRISLLPASSTTSAAALGSAFGLPPHQVPVLGEPRTDVLFDGPTEVRRQVARTRLERTIGPTDGRRIVLYAPTWRDGRADPAVPSAAEWDAIDAWCARTGSVLVLRPHRNARGDYAGGGPDVRLLDPDAEVEVIPVLWAADVLVTDYSSVLVDAAVTGIPIVFFAPDEESYLRHEGLYVDYATLAGGQVERTWSQVIARIDAVAEGGPASATALAHTAEIAATYHAHTDGRSAQRVLTRIAADLRGRR